MLYLCIKDNKLKKIMEGWTEIISFTYPHEAHLAKALLEASGIDVIIKDEFTVQVNNFYSNAIGGVKIIVEEGKAEEALFLLEEAGHIEKNQPKEKEKIETFSEEYKSTCPYCESTNIIRKSRAGYIYMLSILLLGFPFPFLKRRYYCYDCSKEWKVT